MFRTQGFNTSATLPAVNGSPAYPAGGFFSSGSSNATASQITNDFLNYVQEEMVSVVTGAGLSLAASSYNQMWLAIERAVGAHITTISTAGTTTLTADNAGLVIINATAGNITVALPSVVSPLPLRFRFIRTDSSTNVVNFTTSNTLVSLSYGTVLSPYLVLGSPVDIIGDGVSHWIWQANGANSVLSADGYEKIPDQASASGYRIRQWGTGTITITTAATYTKLTVTYPVAFPSAVLNIRATQGGTGIGVTQPKNSDGSNCIVLEGLVINNPTLTTFDVWGFDSTDLGKQDFQWEAIGY